MADVAGQGRFRPDDEIETAGPEGPGGAEGGEEAGGCVVPTICDVTSALVEIVNGDEPPPAGGRDPPVMAPETDRGVLDLVDRRAPAERHCIRHRRIGQIARPGEHRISVEEGRRRRRSRSGDATTGTVGRSLEPRPAKGRTVRNGIYHCPVEVTMEVIGGRWTPVVLAHLKESPRRFSQLRRLIPDISEKMLAQRLRSLEAEGMVIRTVISDTPPHVEYQLSDAGLSLIPTLQALYDWGEHWSTINGLTIDPTIA